MIVKEKILFNKEECDSIIWDSNVYTTNWNKIDRKYDSQPIKYSSETKWIFDKLINFFEEQTGFRIIKIKETIHFHKFKNEDWFNRHNDVAESRLYAIGVLLNDNFEGGDFSLYNKNEYVLNKTLGNTYLFDVRIEHEIKPILKGERYSLLWFLQNEHVELNKNKLL